MTEALPQGIEREAKERWIKPNAVMNESHMHCGKSITPSDLMVFQDFANTACKMLGKYFEADAKILEIKGENLWTFLK